MPSKLYHLPDGRTLAPGVPFTMRVLTHPAEGNNPAVFDDVQYPSNFLELAPPDVLDRMTITVETVPDPVAPVASKEELIATADAKIIALQEAGVVINGVPITTTEKGLTLLNGAVSRADKNPAAICNWVVAPGVKVDLNAATVIAIGVAVGDWINAGYVALNAVYDAILAGTITTHEQVEDPARWPPTSITTG